jgi:hypothetical protein
MQQKPTLKWVEDFAEDEVLCGADRGRVEGGAGKNRRGVG